MLNKVDSLFGHVIEERDGKAVYRDDGTPVTAETLRPCLGCKVRCAEGHHDPCIANLPGTLNACCGHGLARTPVHGNPNGYVALEDGRTFRFLGDAGGESIRAATRAALAGLPLPEGFVMDDTRMWWSGLTAAQRDYVHANTRPAIAALVQEETGAPVVPGFLEGEKPWWEGLDEAAKARVWARLGEMTQRLRQESLDRVPSR